MMSLNSPEHSIVITRDVKAPSRDVYAAWTEPVKMERWLGKVSADVRVGGAYRFESQEGYIYTG